MGSHAKPRTTGRKTALGALALGATLTGIGLTAAALDPATAVLTANGSDEGAGTQLSGLSSPVSLSLSPAADAIPDLSSVPFQSTNAANAASALTRATGSGTTYDPTGGTVDSAGSVIRRVTSGAASTGTEGSVKPIVASTPTSTSTSTKSSGSGSSGSSGSGYTGKHAQPAPAAPPSAITPLTSAVTSTVATVTSTTSKVLPAVESLVSKIPVVSTVVQDTGLLGSSPAASSVSGTSADPVSTVTGAVGSLPLVGSLLGGSGSGQSTVTVPGLSTLTGLL